jgi:hypothetical protein
MGEISACFVGEDKLKSNFALEPMEGTVYPCPNWIGLNWGSDKPSPPERTYGLDFVGLDFFDHHFELVAVFRG